MPKQHQLATWNQERDCWETGVEDIFGHSDVYSETWPTSGMTANGVAYELPTWAPPTPDTGSSSSPPEEMLLKTPTSQLAINGGSQHPDKRKAGGHGPTLADEVEHLLPTVTTQDAAFSGAGFGPSLGQIVREALLPTPTVGMTQGGSRTRSGSRSGELLLPGVAESIGDRTSLLFVDGKPCEEPPLPLPN